MDYITAFFIGGIILMIIDLMFININLLVFLGIGAMIASILESFGFGTVIASMFQSFGFVLPTDILLISLIAMTGISTSLLTLLLWKPLKNFQNKVTESDESSDIIGKKLLVSKEITLTKNGQVSFSGANWTSKLDPDFVTDEGLLLVDSEVTVTKIVGNILWVKK